MKKERRKNPHPYLPTLVGALLIGLFEGKRNNPGRRLWRRINRFFFLVRSIAHSGTAHQGWHGHSCDDGISNYCVYLFTARFRICVDKLKRIKKEWYEKIHYKEQKPARYCRCLTHSLPQWRDKYPSYRTRTEILIKPGFTSAPSSTHYAGSSGRSESSREKEKRSGYWVKTLASVQIGLRYYLKLSKKPFGTLDCVGGE